MNISSLGAYNVEALNLISRLASSRSGTGSNDLDSLLDSRTDSLGLSSTGQWLSRLQDSNPFKTDFDSLGDYLSSGDLSAAKSAYTAMKEKLQAHSGSGEDPFASEFTAIGTALESGDVAAAQSAWKAMQSKLESFGDARKGEDNPLKKDMDQLGELISSGDLSGAQKLYGTMQEKMQGHGATTDASRDSFNTLFSAIGSALESGDTAAAQSAWSALDHKLQKMGPPPPPPDGGSASSGTDSTSVDNALIQALLASLSWQSSSSTNTSAGS